MLNGTNRNGTSNGIHKDARAFRLLHAVGVHLTSVRRHRYPIFYRQHMGTHNKGLFK